MSTKNAHFHFDVDGSSLPPIPRNKIIRSVINLPCTLNKVRECRMGSQNGQSRETGNIGYNENIILFCYQHGTALCERCFRDNHKKCSPVTKIANAYDKSTQQRYGGVPLEDIETSVHNLSLILLFMLYFPLSMRSTILS
jgi:hypothetical protein